MRGTHNVRINPSPQSLSDLPDDSLARWASFAGASLIGRGSQLPLHAQIQQLLLDLIERGVLQPGERLPAERDLAGLFGVSLAPVPQATWVSWPMGS